MTNPNVCMHGELRRQCDRCEMLAENERLCVALSLICYEAHCLVMANSTISMSGRDVKPSFRRLNEAKIAGERLLREQGSVHVQSEGKDG